MGKSKQVSTDDRDKVELKSETRSNRVLYLFVFLKEKTVGIPWQSSGWDSELPVQGAQVRSLVGELRSCMPHSAPKNKNKKD